MKSCEYSKHLEKQHRVIFCVKKIMKAGKKYQSIPPNDHETGEAEPKVIRTDADKVKEMVEWKFLTKKGRSKTKIILKKVPSLIE